MSDNALLPPNATPLEIALADVVSRISDIPVPNGDLYNPELCLENPLPWLAWAFSVDEWNPDWTLQQKRQTVENSVYIHRHKGTVGAMKSALSALGFDITLMEWHQLEPKGDPYTFGFNLEIFEDGFSNPTDFGRVMSVANGAKNARSHLTFFNIETTRDGPLYFCGVPIFGETITIPSGN